jgi:16S rRNA processing protein RimM
VIRLDREVERGASIEVPLASLPAAEDGSYYVFQLVGLKVEEEGGDQLGRVTEVTFTPANDVLELDTGLLLPLVDACVQEVDLAGGRILVKPGFSGRG